MLILSKNIQADIGKSFISTSVYLDDLLNIYKKDVSITRKWYLIVLISNLIVISTMTKKYHNYTLQMYPWHNEETRHQKDN